MTTLYEVLGVKPDATTEEIKQAFRRRALECHPDVGSNRGGSHKEFRRVTEAYEVLRSPDKRKEYDRIRAQSPGGTSGWEGQTNPSGNKYPGEDEFEEFFRRWKERQGFGSPMEEEIRKERQQAEYMARAAAWDAEKASARLVKERRERVRQRTHAARVARQAATLRGFWQTHRGATWQDGLVASAFVLATVSAWQMMPQTSSDVAVATDQPE